MAKTGQTSPRASPGGSVVKNLPSQCRTHGFDLWPGRSRYFLPRQLSPRACVTELCSQSVGAATTEPEHPRASAHGLASPPGGARTLRLERVPLPAAKSLRSKEDPSTAEAIEKFTTEHPKADSASLITREMQIKITARNCCACKMAKLEKVTSSDVKLWGSWNPAGGVYQPFCCLIISANTDIYVFISCYFTMEVYMCLSVIHPYPS